MNEQGKNVKTGARNRRGTLLVHRQTQHTLLLYANGLGIFLGTIIILVMRSWIARIHEQTALLALPPDHAYLAFMAARERSLTVILAVSSLGTLVALNMIGMLLTHRIAGPIHAVRIRLDEIAEGKPPRDLKLRKGDFFKELETSYNRLVVKLRG